MPMAFTRASGGTLHFVPLGAELPEGGVEAQVNRHETWGRPIFGTGLRLWVSHDQPKRVKCGQKSRHQEKEALFRLNPSAAKGIHPKKNEQSGQVGSWFELFEMTMFSAFFNPSPATGRVIIGLRLFLV